MKHLPRFNALGKLKALTHATTESAPSCRPGAQPYAPGQI